MKYIYKEYKHIFDTPAKMEQETVIVNKIMDLLNKKKYDSIEEFINRNQTYQDFLKKNQLENVVKHFGNTLTELDFKTILNELVKLTEKKRQFDRENIETTRFGDSAEYNTYEGKDKTFFLDNSHSGMSIERQMEELQPTEEKFQTSDIKQNTENMMKELEQNKKESLELYYLKDFIIEDLNPIQKRFFDIAANYQLDIQSPVRVDLNRGIIVDKDNNILRMEIHGDEYTIVDSNQQEKANSIKEPIKEPKTLQKSLIPSPNTIYSNNEE